jgi:mRNA-degrading endonuclease RelE of RelBE toxin-antitoxin system
MPTVLEIHPRAEIALAYLAKPVQERIWKVIEFLKTNILEFLQKEKLSNHHLTKLVGLNNVFMMLAPNNVRIIFSVDNDKVNILDVLEHDKFQRLQRLYEEVQ